ncbi:MAG: group 1 truncated hemoglobin [Rhodocyclaceae bacterium]|nr:group 1 truncated hemoglobin [Rhodocyclaceae bacterium]
MSTMTEGSLFDRLGGSAAIDAAVDTFYRRVQADPRIAHFFTNTDMAQQSAHQKRFLTVAFGGAPAYAGRSLRTAHQGLVDRLGLDDSHFDAVVEQLAATLTEMGVAEPLIGEVAQVAESVRDEVLCR